MSSVGLSPLSLSFPFRLRIGLEVASPSPRRFTLLPAYWSRLIRHCSVASSHSEQRSIFESCAGAVATVIGLEGVACPLPARAGCRRLS